MENTERTFNDIFEELCEEKGVTKVQVRKHLAISQSTMASWKSKGATPNAATLTRLADYFGVTVEYLRGEDVMTGTIGMDKQTLWFWGVLRRSIEDEERIRQVIDKAYQSLSDYEEGNYEKSYNEFMTAMRFLKASFGKIDVTSLLNEYTLWDEAMKDINNDICMLNKNGYQEAKNRIHELTEIKKYQIDREETIVFAKKQISSRLPNGARGLSDLPEDFKNYFHGPGHVLPEKTSWEALSKMLGTYPYEFFILKPSEKLKAREAHRTIERAEKLIDEAKEAGDLGNEDTYKYIKSLKEKILGEIFDIAYTRTKNLKD